MPRILVVDDVAADQRLVQAHLDGLMELQLQSAANGLEALRKLNVDLFDLVITDLLMPTMDGLELVRQVRRQYPDIPVILMTGHGSELIAVEALKAGAASYVPKSHLAERLRETVDEVLALAKAGRTDERLINALQGADFDFRLENDPELIPPLVDLVQTMIGGMMGSDRTTRLRIGVALEEALLNAVYHGNLEISAADLEQAKTSLFSAESVPLAHARRTEGPFSDRRIYFRAEISTKEVRFVVRDEGPGFDHRAVTKPPDPKLLDSLSGRGLILIRAFMDEVGFNDAGNEVILIKRREPIRTAGHRRATPALFDVERQSGTLILVPRRNITSFLEDQVRSELLHILRHLDPQVQNVVIDFSKISYFGSSMLEAMRILMIQVHRLKGKVAACNLSPVGREILRIARLDHIWTLRASRQDALNEILATPRR